MFRRSGYILKCVQLFVLILVACAVTSRAQTTSFTYQGKLGDGGGPATGSYDFQFTLWDALSGGTQQPQPSPVTVTRTNVAVGSGIFTVQLDFGANAFPGADRYLEIGVRPTGGGSFTVLAPRQQISSAPYSVKSLNADNAVTATNATQLGGVAANQFVVTGDARLSDARPPTAGSANYIQNQSAGPQASSNFNISGNGTANILSATTQYNLGGQRMLSVSGPFSASLTAMASNTFLGENAGVNTTPAGTINDPNGKFNTFTGALTGVANTTGGNNSFFGGAAGNANTTGSQNSFFGLNAGRFNTTGDSNTFSGGYAGFRNTTQHDNTFIGYSAGFANGTNDTTNLANLNTFVGSQSGQANTTGFANSFFGLAAGGSNLDGYENSFFGRGAGFSNVHGIQNSIFGDLAGNLNVNGGFNAFFGYYAGHSNNSGDLNSFFGSGAGAVNQTGSYNSAFGSGANFGGTNLVNATSIGANARVDVNNALVLGSVNGINGATANTVVGIGTTTPGVTLDILNSTSSVGVRARSTAGSSIIFLDRVSASTPYSSQIYFQTAGSTTDFGMGTAQGSAGASDFSIYNYGTNSNAFTIQKSNGNIGIGTVTPGYRLHVDQTTPNAFATHIQTEGLATGTSYGLVVSAGTNSSDISFQSRNQAGSSMLMVRGDGLVNIANTLSVTGSASIGGNLTLGGGLQLQNMIGPGGLSVCVNSSGPPFVLVVCSSSYRYKTNINNLREGLSIINRLKPIAYVWKIGGQPDIGFGAEDVESIDRRLVFYNDKGQVEGVKYDRIGVVLVNAVKEQQAQIEKLQEQLTRQQEQITQQQRQAKQQQAAFAAQQQQIDALKRLVCRKHPRTNVRRMN
jgi:hypothetical protein